MKLPIGCESLATLRPVQLIGGEQTLFAVTGDGKVLKYTTIFVLPEDIFRILVNFHEILNESSL